MKYIHIKSLQHNGTVCGKVLDDKTEVFDRDGATAQQKMGRKLCPKCAKSKQKKQLTLF